MQRWFDLSDVPRDTGPSAVTLGNFDGVHRGHQEVLARLVELARGRGLPSVVVTFEPHPLAVLHPRSAPPALCSLEHRLELLQECGPDAVLVMEFTRELASWSPEHFVDKVLVELLGARAVVVGRDTRFGHRNSGDVAALRNLGGSHGFEVQEVLDLGGDDEAHPEGRRWSSTWVRELVTAGEVSRAAQVLGRCHRVSGTVVHGDHRGRTLGFPTANLGPDAVGLVPADGVYAGRLLRRDLRGGPGVRGQGLPAAISVGTNPTFDGKGRRVEAHVVDRDDLDLYGEVVDLDLVRRLRPTVRFSGAQELVERMRRDVQECREILSVSGRVH
ncbi:MAG: riboflavin kinase / adenylyltransferase [Actinomycetota bacterium]|nr:riboflavin kinase / adenylyltransferase [Actinomycetota bacterium]